MNEMIAIIYDIILCVQIASIGIVLLFCVVGVDVGVKLVIRGRIQNWVVSRQVESVSSDF